MAITQDEMQSIVSAVLSSIRTNSRTIDQLTPVTSLSDNDSFEINGGKRVTYKVLMGLIASLVSTEHDSLKKLIANNVLKSVNIDATENSATLSISSGGKTITATIPIATTSNAGLMTAAHERLISLLQTTAEKAQTTADAAKAVTDSKGQTDGIAPLDANGKVPASHLPGYVDDVVEFGTVVSGVTVELGAVSEYASTDAGCMVVYDSERGVFLLAVSRRRPAGDGGIDATAEVLSTEADVIMDDDYQGGSDSGASVDRFRYYSNWQDGDVFGRLSLQGREPEAGKLYVSTMEKRVYHWSGSALGLVGSGLVLGNTPETAFPGDEGAATTEKVDELRDEFDSHVSSSERRIEELQDAVDSYADPVLVGYPILTYKLGKIPLVSLNGVVDDVAELEGRESDYGTTNYYFVRREKAIYWVDAGYAEGPWRSISTMGGAPIMITDALFVCGNVVYSFDGEVLQRFATTADLEAYAAENEGQHAQFTALINRLKRDLDVSVTGHVEKTVLSWPLGTKEWQYSPQVSGAVLEGVKYARLSRNQGVTVNRVRTAKLASGDLNLTSFNIAATGEPCWDCAIVLEGTLHDKPTSLSFDCAQIKTDHVLMDITLNGYLAPDGGNELCVLKGYRLPRINENESDADKNLRVELEFPPEMFMAGQEVYSVDIYFYTDDNSSREVGFANVQYTLAGETINLVEEIHELHAGKADRSELSNVMSEDVDGDVEAVEPNLLTDALRKTEQALTDEEKAQVLENTGVTINGVSAELVAEAEAAGAVYNRATGFFELNGLTDITEVQMRLIYQKTAHLGWTTRDVVTLLEGDIRTNFPIKTWTLGGKIAMSRLDKIEVLAISSEHPIGPWTLTEWSFASMPLLREVRGVFALTGVGLYSLKSGLPKLERLMLTSLSFSVSFESSPLLSLDSISYMIANAVNTSPITITLHPDAYARVTDEIFAAAAEKQINIASI